MAAACGACPAVPIKPEMDEYMLKTRSGPFHMAACRAAPPYTLGEPRQTRTPNSHTQNTDEGRERKIGHGFGEPKAGAHLWPICAPEVESSLV